MRYGEANPHFSCRTRTVIVPYVARAAELGGSARNPLSLDQARLLAAMLLERVETLDTKGTTLVQAVMAGTLRYALRDPHHAVEPDLEHRDRVILTLNSVAGRLIETMHNWSGPSGSRWAAWGRALRESYCLMDKFCGSGGPNTAQIAALLLASGTRAARSESAESATQREPQEQLNTLGTPANEALAILSANWKESPLKRKGLAVQAESGSNQESLHFDWETLLARAASSLGAEEGSEESASFNEREFRSSLPVPDAAGHFPIELPVEAVLLRAPPDVARWALLRLSELQGCHDGKAYEFLQRIGYSPDDLELRAEYARYTVVNPFIVMSRDRNDRVVAIEYFIEVKGVLPLLPLCNRLSDAPASLVPKSDETLPLSCGPSNGSGTTLAQSTAAFAIRARGTTKTVCTISPGPSVTFPTSRLPLKSNRMAWSRGSFAI